MTERERFHAVMNFAEFDRPPYRELYAWPETYERWHAEGYPRHADYRVYFGFDRYEDVGVESDIHPAFTEEIIEETEDHIIKRDWRGVHLKLSRHSRSIPYFYSFPVRDRDSYRRFKAKLNPSTVSRFPLAWDIRVEELNKRDFPVYFGMARTIGFFGPVREWVGPEALLMGFYDDSAWVHEMMDDYADYIIKLTTPMLEKVTPDCIHFFEDMCYRGGSLISPAHFREFMMHPYRRVLDHFRSHGVPFFVVDTDGAVDELIPLFIELGIHGMYPFEVQAGMNVRTVRKKYSRDFVLWGGLDKRVIERKKKDIEAEVMGKVPELLESGGYIPMLDHEPHPGIPFDNFCYYRKLLRKVCEG